MKKFRRLYIAIFLGLAAVTQVQAIQRVPASELRLEAGAALLFSTDREFREDYSAGLTGRFSLSYTARHRLILGVQYRLLHRDRVVPGSGGYVKAHLLGVQIGAIPYRQAKNEIAVTALVYRTQARRVETAVCPYCPNQRVELTDSGTGLGGRIAYSRFLSRKVTVCADLEYNQTFLDDSIVESGRLGGFWVGVSVGWFL
jgi:hypothetical protein